MSEASDTSRISPTAHYTGYCWYHHGLSHPALATRFGRYLYGAGAPAQAVYERLRGASLRSVLLQRHVLMDHVLHAAIKSGRITQVVEIAAGLSPRGLRFARAYPQLLYVDADLPDMARQKEARLNTIKSRPHNLKVVALNALEDEGPMAMKTVLDKTLSDSGTAIITEGLMPYFPTASVLDCWTRFSDYLSSKPYGLYMSDIYLRNAHGHRRATRIFTRLLQVFARGRVFMHFEDQRALTEAARVCTFDTIALLQPSEFARLPMPIDDFNLVNVLMAQVGENPITLESLYAHEHRM